MLCARSILCPGLRDPTPHVGDVGREEVFISKLSVFDVLETKGDSMVEHRDPSGSPIGRGNFPSEFHDGRNFGAGHRLRFLRPIECWRRNPLVTNRKILTYTYRWVANLSQGFSSTHGGDKSAQKHKGNDHQHKETPHFRYGEPTGSREPRLGLRRRHLGP
jgi:hypothetical protein